MKLSKVVFKIEETIPTKEYGNVKPSLMMEYEFDDHDNTGVSPRLPSLYPAAQGEFLRSYDALKESAIRKAGGRKVEKRESWKFDEEDEF